MALVEILKRPEGKTLEFKRDLSTPVGALKTIVAFANTAGGTLLLGVEDKSRHVRDVRDPLDLEERLANLISDRIAPRLLPETDYAQRGAPLRLSIFDDRLEVENPGLLPFGLTVEDLPRGVSKLRNRVLGRVFHALGLIEQWGSGIQRMSAACREAGLAAPVFEELATRFRVTLSTARVGRPVLDQTDRAILVRLAGGKGRLTSEIAEAIDLTPRATRTRLARLVGRGLVREIGTGPQDPKRRYYEAD